MSTQSHQDKVNLKPNLLPYAHHVAAPKIQPVDLTNFQQIANHKVNRTLQKRYQEILRQAEELQKDYELNQEVYSAKYSFEPLVGETYHLYINDDNTKSLSLITPSQWKKKHLYSVMLNADHTWSRVDVE